MHMHMCMLMHMCMHMDMHMHMCVSSHRVTGSASTAVHSSSLGMAAGSERREMEKEISSECAMHGIGLQSIGCSRSET